jgi:hypothetical protein
MGRMRSRTANQQVDSLLGRFYTCTFRGCHFNNLEYLKTGIAQNRRLLISWPDESSAHARRRRPACHVHKPEPRRPDGRLLFAPPHATQRNTLEYQLRKISIIEARRSCRRLGTARSIHPSTHGLRPCSMIRFRTSSIT